MGLFKSIKDLRDITKQGRELQRKQQEQAGYKPGFGGMMSQMGDQLAQAKEQVTEMNQEQGDRARILQEGRAGEGIIVGMGTPARGATWFNMHIDLEVHVSGRSPYRVNNEYLVPASAQLGPGVKLPIKVDANDPAKIAIDWEKAGGPAPEGQIRPA